MECNRSLSERYEEVRRNTLDICSELKTEDYVVQPGYDSVSPPKWHLGHTSFFFEEFVLVTFVENYKRYNTEYRYIFNSYYESLGDRVLKNNRGDLSRPTVEETFKYRSYIDDAMKFLLTRPLDTKVEEMIILGLNHEEQHQELLRTDIKYILGTNPLSPALLSSPPPSSPPPEEGKSLVPKMNFIEGNSGVQEIGYRGTGFCYDNEKGVHKVYLEKYSISDRLVTNGEYLEFMNASGYETYKWWHSDGWKWVKENNIRAPLYWHFKEGKWYTYTLYGLRELDLGQELCHVSFYEAYAYTSWLSETSEGYNGVRPPTEFEWEASADLFKFGSRWEWSNSAYLPYPRYRKPEGAVGEYNGKFMINQMTLKGSSEATSRGHSRPSYRNFFQPWHQWQFTGIRLAISLPPFKITAQGGGANSSTGCYHESSVCLGDLRSPGLCPERQTDSKQFAQGGGASPTTDERLEYKGSRGEPYSRVSEEDRQFLDDVVRGLSSIPKYLQSKYFYDREGDSIFKEIMNCNEYYLSNCELEILSTYGEEIVDLCFSRNLELDIVELGPGDGTKTVHLLKKWGKRGTYYPIDISTNTIENLTEFLHEEIPGIEIKGFVGDYFEMLSGLNSLSSKRKLVLFLGSNVGNMTIPETYNFLTRLRSCLSPGDFLLTGFDLKKNTGTILSAYSDKDGITKRFNINLLKRINDKLGANFDLKSFEHSPTYDERTGECKSFLVSNRSQTVTLNETTFITFEEGESIFTEISQKYTIKQIHDFTTLNSSESSFIPIKDFYDKNTMFIDSLWMCREI